MCYNPNHTGISRTSNPQGLHPNKWDHSIPGAVLHGSTQQMQLEPGNKSQCKSKPISETAVVIHAKSPKHSQTGTWSFKNCPTKFRNKRCFTSSIWVCLTIGCPKNCWFIIGSQMFPVKFIGIPHWQTDPYHPRSIRNTSWGPEPRSHPPAVGSLPWAASAAWAA